MSELLDIDTLIEQLLDDDQSFPGPHVLVKYLRELKEFRALRDEAESLRERVKDLDGNSYQSSNSEDTQNKPADHLHEKVMQIKDKMDKAFNSVEHLLEPTDMLLEAAKALRDTIEVAKEKYRFISTNPGAKMISI